MKGVTAAAAIAIALGAAACGSSYGALDTYYAALPAPTGWCRITSGVYAFEWKPSTWPDLLGTGCVAATADGEVAPPDGTTRPAARGSSTLAELVIGPGAAVELPVELPPGLFGMGCELDRVVIAHGLAPADPAIDLRDGETIVPIVHYDDAFFPGVVQPDPRTANPAGITNGPPLTFAGQVGDDPRNLPAATQPPPPPLSDSGARAGTGASSSGGGSIDVQLGALGWSAGVRLELGSDTGAVRQVAPPAPTPLALVAIQHVIHAPAPDRFAIVIRAGSLPLSLGVRLDTEAPGYRPLLYRPRDSTTAVPTHMVPQAAIVLSHCRRDASAVLGGIERATD